MKRIFYLQLLMLLGLLTATSGNAQRFQGGVIAGLSTGQIDGDKSAGYDRVDFIAGGWVSTMLSDNWSGRAELSYIGKGSKIVADNTSEQRTIVRYVEFPFLMQYHFWEDFTLSAGPAPAFLFNSRIEINGTETGDTKYSEFHTFDLAGMADLGYSLTERLQLRLRWSYSVVPFRNHPNWYNHILAYTVSYTF